VIPDLAPDQLIASIADEAPGLFHLAGNGDLHLSHDAEDMTHVIYLQPSVVRAMLSAVNQSRQHRLADAARLETLLGPEQPLSPEDTIIFLSDQLEMRDAELAELKRRRPRRWRGW